MNVLIVDDHRAMREEIASLVNAEADLSVIVQAETAEEGVSKALTLRPDVVLMDVVMPGMNGLEASKAIHDVLPLTRIVVLSNHGGHSLVEAAFEAGASGYVRKDRAFEELVPAIRTVAQGGRYLGNAVGDTADNGSSRARARRAPR